MSPVSGSYLQGEAREVSLRIAFVDYRDVLYCTAALGALDPVEEHLDVAGVAPISEAAWSQSAWSRTPRSTYP